jgi:hypothetical protein
MKNCPECGREATKVIYAGLPTNICSSCDLCFGGFAWVMKYLPYNGWFLEYEGSYLPAFWYWLTTNPEDEED